MNTPETRIPQSSELVELTNQVRSLNRSFVILLVGLFVVSGTLTVFLWSQARWIGKDLDSVRPEAGQVITASQQEEPVIRAFMAKLADYGRTHPDFKPILVKYRLSTNAMDYSSSAGAAGSNTAAKK